MPIEILDIEPQIYVSNTKPNPELFKSIQERNNRDKKPLGGLWTSKKYYKNSKITSPWIEWSKGNIRYDDNVHVWELTIDNPCKILKIDTKSDIRDYSTKYIHEIDGEMYKFNWNYIFNELNCDAMWLTETGLQNLKSILIDKKYSMASWDVESMLWSNWVFDKVINCRKYHK